MSLLGLIFHKNAVQSEFLEFKRNQEVKFSYKM